MRNKKLIPFEVIEKAVAGEPEAVDAVLRHYTAYIKYLSIYKGHINEKLSRVNFALRALDSFSRLCLWVVKRAKSADCFRPQFIMGIVTQ